jgi:hypothetical protein
MGSPAVMLWVPVERRRGVPSKTTKRSSPSSTSAPSSDERAVSRVMVASPTLEAGQARSFGVNTSVLRLVQVAVPGTAGRNTSGMAVSGSPTAARPTMGRLKRSEMLCPRRRWMELPRGESSTNASGRSAASSGSSGAAGRVVPGSPGKLARAARPVGSGTACVGSEVVGLGMPPQDTPKTTPSGASTSETNQMARARGRGGV